MVDQQQTGADVRAGVVVEAAPEQAFAVFTQRMGAWWPLDSYYVGGQPITDAVAEPQAGGRWFERAGDGSECDWGRVLTWEPPSHVVLAWQLAANWTFDPSLRTEVEVRFVAVDAGHTRVELEHRGLEAYGPEALAMRDAFASANGWAGMLEHYAEVAGR
jgi:uncharacterized protein YndB with AHSA1/START domain